MTLKCTGKSLPNCLMGQNISSESKSSKQICEKNTNKKRVATPNCCPRDASSILELDAEHEVVNFKPDGVTA